MAFQDDSKKGWYWDCLALSSKKCLWKVKSSETDIKEPLATWTTIGFDAESQYFRLSRSVWRQLQDLVGRQHQLFNLSLTSKISISNKLDIKTCLTRCVVTEFLTPLCHQHDVTLHHGCMALQSHCLQFLMQPRSQSPLNKKDIVCLVHIWLQENSLVQHRLFQRPHQIQNAAGWIWNGLNVLWIISIFKILQNGACLLNLKTNDLNGAKCSSWTGGTVDVSKAFNSGSSSLSMNLKTRQAFWGFEEVVHFFLILFV